MRGWGACAIALLIAIQVVRSAAVDGLARLFPEQAARIWPSHPDVRISAGMTAIAVAAREGKPVDPAILGGIYAASGAAPLAPEPFLVRGVQAQLSGDLATAERAFLAAKRRNARSLPTRYFLADHYLRENDAAAGLREIAAVARLAPSGIAGLAPYVAAYARQRATWPQLRALFREEPVLEDATLAALSADPANAGAVLALADTRRLGPKSSWLPPLLASLVKAGQYERARDVWAAVARVPRDRTRLIYDPDFTQADPPPPFNWALTSSPAGLAERARGGGLHVIFHGREDGALASQLLVLQPGRYRMTLRAGAGATGLESLKWSLVCATTNAAIASIPLELIMNRPWVFEVPGTCPAQRLELFGTSSDMPEPSEATIRSVALEPQNG